MSVSVDTAERPGPGGANPPSDADVMRGVSYRYPLVVKTPDICGGSARLIRTRIPVWMLVRMRQLGSSEAVILDCYPSLQAIDLVQAWAYADEHREEIERDIRENEEE